MSNEAYDLDGTVFNLVWIDNYPNHTKKQEKAADKATKLRFKPKGKILIITARGKADRERTIRQLKANGVPAKVVFAGCIGKDGKVMSDLDLARRKLQQIRKYNVTRYHEDNPVIADFLEGNNIEIVRHFPEDKTIIYE